MTQIEHAKKVHELAKTQELTVKNLEELLKFDITDCYDENEYYFDGKYGCTVNVYIPICFDPDKAFGLDVCETTNSDYINMYINYDEQGNMELFVDYCNNSTDDGDIGCVVKMTAEEYEAVKKQFREQFERTFSITVENAIKRELEEQNYQKVEVFTMKNTYKVVARIELPFEVQCDSDADAKESVNETLKNMLDDADYNNLVSEIIVSQAVSEKVSFSVKEI